MSKTIVGLFRASEQAEEAVRELKNRGFTDEEVSVIAAKEQEEARLREATTTFEGQDLTDGAAAGGAVGGLAGLLAGAGALVIPGLGPLVAVGPLAATLAGMVTGGIAGGLIDFGIPEEEGRRYEEEIKSGSIMVVVEAESQNADEAATILRESGAAEVKEHSQEN